MGIKSKLAVLLFFVVCTYVVFNRDQQKAQNFQADISSYYLYLPATFIYNDPGNFSFYHNVNAKYNLTNGWDEYGLFNQPTGHRTNKYAVGTCLFELPFFLVAHGYCNMTGAYAADGYTMPYQVALVFCYLFWVTWGLYFMARLLTKYFSDGVSAMTVLCIGFGTNLYYYTAFSPGMSHPISFFLIAGVLYYTDVLYRSGKGFYVLGLLMGLVIITRPVNILVALVPLLWQVYNVVTLRDRLAFWGKHVRKIVVAVLIFFVVCMIQMSYWKYSAGHWIHYSYEGEGFNFLHPNIIKGLFSFQKGWFVYAPIAFIAAVGLVYMWWKDRKMGTVLLLFMAMLVYVVFSWKEWWYGGGYGARALIESLPVMALPLAFVADRLINKVRARIAGVAFTVVLAFFVALNLFQTYQYSLGTINCALMTERYYWRVFGKVRPTGDDMQLLITQEEYDRQRQEIRE